MDLQQFFQDTYNAMCGIIVCLISWLHIGQNQKIKQKVGKDVYEVDKKLLIAENQNKLDRIDINLRFLFEKLGITYQDKK